MLNLARGRRLIWLFGLSTPIDFDRRRRLYGARYVLIFAARESEVGEAD
jgi:hypothetical protein